VLVDASVGLRRAVRDGRHADAALADALVKADQRVARDPSRRLSFEGCGLDEPVAKDESVDLRLRETFVERVGHE